MVVVVEAVKLFIIQTVKGFRRPPLKNRRNSGGRVCAGRFEGAGGGTKSTALPNELEWAIETGLFSFFIEEAKKD